MFHRRFVLPFISAACVLLAAVGVRAESDGPRAIFVISLDATRCDRLYCYGYSRATTPNLDALAQDGVIFEQAYSEDPWTLPAHAALLTGRHPSQTGLTGDGKLPIGTPTLAQQLQRSGYSTAAWTGCSLWFYPWRGLNQGFDHYDATQAFRELRSTLRIARPWLDGHAASKRFVFLHCMDLHSKPMFGGFRFPYEPAGPRFFSRDMGEASRFEYREDGQPLRATHFLGAYNEGKARLDEAGHAYLSALYDDSLRAADHALGRFFERLRRNGQYEQALIVVVADHGEELNDHGRYGHTTVYEECARIPLIVKFPGNTRAGERFGGPVFLSDIAPTVCAAAGVAPPDGATGEDLARFLDGKTTPRPPVVFLQRADWTSARFGPWKCLYNRESKGWSAYNLDKDAREQTNVFETAQAALAPALEAYARYFKEAGAPAIPSVEGLGESQRQLLDALGYLKP